MSRGFKFSDPDLAKRLKDRIESRKAGGYNFVIVPIKEALELVRLLSDNE